MKINMFPVGCILVMLSVSLFQWKTINDQNKTIQILRVTHETDKVWAERSVELGDALDTQQKLINILVQRCKKDEYVIDYQTKGLLEIKEIEDRRR